MISIKVYSGFFLVSLRKTWKILFKFYSNLLYEEDFQVKKAFIQTILLFALSAIFSFSNIASPKKPININSGSKLKFSGLSRQILFEENKGQTSENIKFLSRGRGFNLFLTQSEVVFQLPNTSCGLPNAKIENRILKPCKTLSLTMKMFGANANALIRGIDQAETLSNYYIGSDQRNWFENINNYRAIRYEQIYEGIDIVFRGIDQKLEYDFHVAPGFAPNIIQVEFEGAKRVEIDSKGSLVFKFKGTQLIHQKPFAYQIVDGRKVAIKVRYVRVGKTRIGFKVGTYDQSKELIIDPIIYSTYLGGSQQDLGKDIAVDSSGNIYLASFVNSTNFLDPELPGNGIDMRDTVVTKLNSSGTQVIYNTFLNGSNFDEPYAIDVDSFGNAYVGGITDSPDFPLLNARQTTSSTANGGSDGFITKLSSSGTLVYSTYHGSVTDNNDFVEDLNVDSVGNTYVVGKTRGSDFPVLNAYQPALNGVSDAFLSKLSPSGTLLYSTYFGGNFEEDAGDVDVDNQGNAFITGVALSTIPLKNPCYSGSGNGFVAKFDTNVIGGASLIYSSKLTNNGWAIAVDSGGNARVISITGVGSSGQSKGLKLSPTGNCLSWAFPDTLGTIDDIVVDAEGNSYYVVKLETTSNTFAKGISITKSLPDGTVADSAILNGTQREIPTGVAYNGGFVYVTGYTSSLDFPTTPDALQLESRYSVMGGSSVQGFLAKVQFSSFSQEREPLIFIPGVSGSLLDAIESDNSRTNLWLGLLQNHDRLTLDPNQTQANIIATDTIRSILIPVPIPFTNPRQYYFYPKNVYIQLLNKLINEEHYVEYQVNGQPSRRTFNGCDVSGQMANRPNLFVFAYDWRKSNIENAQALKEYVGCVRRFYPDSKVNILAHSMGGLLARRYIISNPNDHNVNKMVTIGSPWLGAPKAIEVLETGNFGLSPIVFDSTIKRLGEFFKGMHELLPSRTYFDAATRSDFHLANYGNPFKEDGWDVNGNVNAFESYDYDQTTRLLNQQLPRSNPGNNSQLFHDAIGQDNWLGDISGVKYFHTYGQQSYLNTTVQVVAKYRIKCHQAGCQRENYYDVVRGRGDGTVPTISAERSFGPYYNLLPRNDKPFFSSNRTQDAYVEHTNLTQNPSVQQEVVNFLNSNTQPLSILGNQFLKDDSANSTESLLEPGAESVEPPLREGYYVNVSGVNYIEIRDDLGNVNSPLDGGYTLPVPSVNYDLTSEKSTAITTPTEGSYTLTFRSSNEPIFLETIKGMGNLNPTEAVRYLDLNLPANVNAQFQVSSTGITDLHYDSDGDGSFETFVLPTSHTTGNAARDLTPPTIQIGEIVQPSRQLVIDASDTNSGVRKIYYSFDGTNFQEYVSSISLTRSQSGTIHTFADDNSANRSLITTYTFVPIPDPVVIIASPLSGSVFPIGTSVNFAGSFSGDICSSHTAVWTFDNSSQTGTVNEATREIATNYTFTSAGVYLVVLTVNNNCGGTGTANTIDDLMAMVVIYNPDGGFVTGGGWIDSPLGAYTPNPNLTGRASFGFTSKYQRGANVPTGNTEFQFRLADLNFKSTSYDWLVVAGAKAQFKGSGIINNSGIYGFMLTAIDGQINGGGGMNRFRIKIWNKSTSNIIYDNQLGGGDNENPTTVIGGGSIIIHRW